MNELQERVAALLGQEAALFLPTATLANQIALKLHSRPGDVLVAERHAHVVIYEYGGAAAHAGLMIEPIDGRARAASASSSSTRRPSRARRRPTSARPCSRSRTRTTPRAAAAGRSTSSRRVTSAARERGLATHLDGARLLNAAVATGVPAAEIGGAVRHASRSASRRGSAARSARCSRARRSAIERALAREAPLRRRDAAGGHRRRRRRVRARPPRRAARGRPRARAAARRGLAAAGLPVDLDQVETNFVQLDVGALGLGRDEALARLRDAGRRPLVDDPPDGRPRRDAPRRRRRGRSTARSSSRRARSGSVPPPETLAERLDRLLATAQAEQRMPSVSAAVVPRRRGPLAAGARARRRRARRGGDAGARVPHRLDHEDVHRRLHPPAPRRDGARPRRPAADAHPRGRPPGRPCATRSRT